MQHKYYLRIYENEILLDERPVADLKVASYFVTSRACYNKEIWGELFNLNPDDAQLISFDGEIEPATDGKE